MEQSKIIDTLETYQGPALLLITLYTTSKYVHDESRWLRCSMAEVEQCSTAGGSPPRTYMNLCALERR